MHRAPVLALLALTLVIPLSAFGAKAVEAPPAWSANVRANTDISGFGQHEPGLAVSPVRPGVVVVAAKDYRVGNVKKVWIYASRDGGQTWPTQLMMPGIPANIATYSDPVVTARDDGRMYVTVLGVGSGSEHGLWTTWSDDDGLTWVPSVAITYNDPAPGGIDDKEWLTVDNDPASPYYHRLYCVWRAFSAADGLSMRYSSDDGSTWSARTLISFGDDEYNFPVVAPGGTVYDFYMNDWSARTPSVGTLMFVRSGDGGATWSAAQAVAPIHQPQTPPHPQDDWRFFSIVYAAADPNNADRLWAAWTDDYGVVDGPMDVVYVRTTDGGATWTAPERLSHDPTGTATDHITPVLFAQKLGGATRLHALWLDRRDDPSNVLFRAWHTYTDDGGLTWQPDQVVSDAAFNLNLGLPPGSGNAAGDYWGLGASGPWVYGAWTDTRNGEQDIYTSRYGVPLASLVQTIYVPVIRR